MREKLLVIADDFTGATDTGVQFAKAGFKTAEVLYDKAAEGGWTGLNVGVVDTESRFDAADTAYAKVKKAVSVMGDTDIKVYKKMDSTLRGNCGAELEAAMAVAGVETALVAPAYPENGRTTVNGNQLVKGIPLAQTEFAKDPRTPVSDSYIPSILSRQTQKSVGIIKLSDVEKGPEAIVSRIRELKADGVQIVVLDAVSDKNLEDIALCAETLGRGCIMAGSAGLADQVARLYRRDLGVLVAAGSVSEATRRQILYAAQCKSAKVIDLDLKEALADPEGEEARVSQMIEAWLQQGKDVILRSAERREQVEEAWGLGDSLGLSRMEVSERIALLLGYTARWAYDTQPLIGLVLTGGDIAIKTIQGMGVPGVEIQEEILPGIPCCRFLGKTGSSIPVVTKAGGFGEEDALVRIIEYLKGRNHV